MKNQILKIYFYLVLINKGKKFYNIFYFNIFYLLFMINKIKYRK